MAVVVRSSMHMHKVAQAPFYKFLASLHDVAQALVKVIGKHVRALPQTLKMMHASYRMHWHIGRPIRVKQPHGGSVVKFPSNALSRSKNVSLEPFIFTPLVLARHYIEIAANDFIILREKNMLYFIRKMLGFEILY